MEKDPVDKVRASAVMRFKEQELMFGWLEVVDGKVEMRFTAELGIVKVEQLKKKAMALAASRRVEYTQAHLRHFVEEELRKIFEGKLLRSVVFEIRQEEPRP